jgi:hypothetical protein
VINAPADTVTGELNPLPVAAFHLAGFVFGKTGIGISACGDSARSIRFRAFFKTAFRLQRILCFLPRL